LPNRGGREKSVVGVACGASIARFRTILGLLIHDHIFPDPSTTRPADRGLKLLKLSTEAWQILVALSLRKIGPFLFVPGMFRGLLVLNALIFRLPRRDENILSASVGLILLLGSRVLRQVCIRSVPIPSVRDNHESALRVMLMDF
jgi:hypothetical protein